MGPDRIWLRARGPAGDVAERVVRGVHACLREDDEGDGLRLNFLVVPELGGEPGTVSGVVGQDMAQFVGKGLRGLCAGHVGAHPVSEWQWHWVSPRLSSATAMGT